MSEADWDDAYDEAIGRYRDTADYDGFRADCLKLGLKPRRIKDDSDVIDQEEGR